MRGAREVLPGSAATSRSPPTAAYSSRHDRRGDSSRHDRRRPTTTPTPEVALRRPLITRRVARLHSPVAPVLSFSLQHEHHHSD